MFERTAQVNILLVDNARVLLHSLGQDLQLICGVQIAGTSLSADAAIVDFDCLEPDMVILVIQLGQGDGWDVLKHIRRRGNRRRIFVFSNDANALLSKKFLARGAGAILDKSFEFDQLYKAVKQIANDSPKLARLIELIGLSLRLVTLIHEQTRCKTL